MWTLVRQQSTDNFNPPELKEIDGRAYKLGRTAEVKCDSPVISRAHCEIELRNGAWFIRDLGSLNGTFVNKTKGEPQQWMRIDHNALIGLGAPNADPEYCEEHNPEEFFIFRFINKNPPIEKTDDGIEILTVSDSDDDQGIVPAECDKVVEKSTPQAISGQSSRQKNEESAGSSTFHAPIEATISPPKPSVSKPSKDDDANSSLTKAKAGPRSWKNAQAEKVNTDKTRKRPSDNNSNDKVSRKRPKTESVPKRRPAKKLPSTSGSSDEEDVEPFPLLSKSNQHNKETLKNDKMTRTTPKQDDIIQKKKTSESPRASTSGNTLNNAIKSTKDQKKRSHPVLRWDDGEEMFELVITLPKVVKPSGNGYEWDRSVLKRISKENMVKIERQLNHQKCSKELTTSSIGHEKGQDNIPITTKSTSSLRTSTENMSNAVKQKDQSSVSDYSPPIAIESPPRVNNDDDDAYSNDSRESLEYEDMHDDGEQMEWIEPPVVDVPPSSKEPRKTKFLENAPTPRMHRPKPSNINNNQYSKATTKLMPPPAPTQSAGQILSEKRKERLRQLSEKDREAKLKAATVTPVVTHSNEVPKVKLTKKSRNDDLFADIVGKNVKSTNEEQQQAPSGTPTAITISDDLRCLMPMQIIGNRQVATSTTNIHQSQPKRIPHTLAQNGTSGPGTMKQYMQKEFDNVIPEPSIKDAQSTEMNDAHAESSKPKSTVTTISEIRGPSFLSGPQRNRTSKSSPIDPVQPYRDILKWNAKWLEEQGKTKKAPPVQGQRLVASTLPEYRSYDTYLEIMYPLLLVELWATIHSDYTGERSNMRHIYKPDGDTQKRTLYEFDIGIENISQVPQCPLLLNSNRPKNVVAPSSKKTPVPPSEWTAITCHAFTDEDTVLDRASDLVVVTLHFKKLLDGTQMDNESPELQNRKVFAFVQMLGEPVPVDSSTNVHKALYKRALENKKPRKKQNIQLTCFLLKDEMDRVSYETPGQIKKISYISSKMRDFKSILTLTESGLFEKILKPDLKAPIFDQLGKTLDTSSTIISTLAKQLNSLQKAVVYQISQRILNDNEPEVMLLHGPPGTGKTSVIVGLILQLLKAKTDKKSDPKPKILVCTPSNTAVDEIMTKLDQFLTQHYPGEEKPILVRMGNENSQKTKKFGLDTWATQRCKGGSTALDDINKTIDDLEKEIANLDTEINARAAKKEDPGSRIYEKQMLQARLGKHKEDKRAFMVSRSAKPNSKNLEIERQNVLVNADVICSTLSSCNNTFMKKLFGRTRHSTTNKRDRPKFTCCIVDEATQSTEPESLAPLMLDVIKLVLVGDPLQLPATVLSHDASEKNFADSLFTRHYNFYKKHFKKVPSPVMRLEYQYRMHPEILKFPNEYFYDGVLKSAAEVLRRARTTRLKPYVFINVAGSESVSGGKVNNPQEVRAILEILKTVQFQKYYGPQSFKDTSRLSIGIITPYKEQKSDILKEMKAERSLKPDFVSNIEVDTVDSFQGREKDIIILSCVRTRFMGFLTNRQRLNVALTRAKQSLFIIGDAVFLNNNDMFRKLMDDATKRGLFMKLHDNEFEGAKDGLRSAIEKIILTREEKSEITEDIRLPRGLPIL